MLQGDGTGDTTVLGNVGGPRLQARQDADDHRDTPPQDQGDVVPHPHASRDEMGGQPIGMPIEVSVGENPALVFDRDRRWIDGGVPLDRLVDRFAGNGASGSPSVLPEKPAIPGGQTCRFQQDVGRSRLGIND
ncbi:hypothetical protein GCM10027598_60190 [Amycolatopsis oliviviridis]|uniref:Uncharacterized protein n=1 Tax=Amycolatopsis oliviviridis TaxID=1471590 RepID=A0ABQ3MAZ2_9PSEU|nr:hypothetical protein GCM10017790_83360 [Amycolatopsis oliviviridis]